MIGPEPEGVGAEVGGLFPLGRMLATPSALAAVSNNDIGAALLRHMTGDWGDVCPEDWQANQRALEEKTRLFSVYHSADGQKFWIITEADRSCTTVLLPEDY